MYRLSALPQLEKKLKKLARKNPKQLAIILKKTEEIVRNPHKYKNLRAPLQHWKRIHIDKHFVLVFSVNENTQTVTLEDFEHHDKVYGFPR